MSGRHPTPLLDALLTGVRIESEASMVTSGYQDRYVSVRNSYECVLPSKRRIILGSDYNQMFEAILELVSTAGEYKDKDAVWDRISTHRPPKSPTMARWQSFSAGALCSVQGAVNWRAVEAFLDLHRPSGIRDEARADRERLAAEMGPKEREWLIWGLYQCNRANRELQAAGLREGRQVELHIPGYEWPLADDAREATKSESGLRM